MATARRRGADFTSLRDMSLAATSLWAAPPAITQQPALASAASAAAQNTDASPNCWLSTPPATPPTTPGTP